MDAFDFGATLEDLFRAAGVRNRFEPLMLDLAMRPAGETQDLADFAASGADSELVRRLWSAFGLPDSASPVVRVTPDAADALRLMTGMASLFGEDAALGVARVVGSSMARLAETISGTWRVGDEVPRVGDRGRRLLLCLAELLGDFGGGPSHHKGQSGQRLRAAQQERRWESPLRAPVLGSGASRNDGRWGIRAAPRSESSSAW